MLLSLDRTSPPPTPRPADGEQRMEVDSQEGFTLIAVRGVVSDNVPTAVVS